MKISIKRQFFVIFLLILVPFQFLLVTESNVNKLALTRNIAVVFSPGATVFDNSFNEMILQGLVNAKTNFDVNIDFTVPTDASELNASLVSYATDSNVTWDLIVTIGFLSISGIQEFSNTYPNQRFSIIDAIVNNANVSSIIFREQEGSFLAGAMAAMVSETEIIGFLGGENSILINRFRSGYEQGAKWINPNIQFLSQYSLNQSNPWNDVSGAKTVTEQFITDGADIVYTAAGRTGLGTFEAVDNSRNLGRNIFAIGVDADQDSILPGGILTSMMKRVDVAVYNEIRDISLQSWSAGQQTLGLAEDGVGISDMEFTSYIRDSQCTNTFTRFEVVEDLKQAVINGTLPINETLMNPNEFNTVPHMCSFSPPKAPFSFTETLTTTETISTSYPVTITEDQIDTTTETTTETESIVFSTTTTTTTIGVKTSYGFQAFLIISSLLIGVILINKNRKTK
ncbi:MAG: BMP family ABC transporter substrate-binding protein [Candidatus Hodarchaeales archaeon]|jgi:basic membrane protein A